MTDDDGEDVLAELEAELPGFVPETFGEFLGVSYDSDDYELICGLADSEMLDTAAPAQIAGYGVSRFPHDPGAMCAAVFAAERSTVRGDCFGVVERRVAEHGHAFGFLASARLPACRARGHPCATVAIPGPQGYYGNPASHGPEHGSRGGSVLAGSTAPKEATT